MGKSSQLGLGLALVLVVGLIGCGGGDEEGQRTQAARPAASPAQFASRFLELTGVRLRPHTDVLGTQFEPAERPDTYDLYGTYSIDWPADAEQRRLLLGSSEPDPEGIQWERDRYGWTATKRIGPLVLTWIGGRRRATSPRWDRIEGVVEAAYLGDSDRLPAEQRSCESAGLDPDAGDTGTCSLNGVAVTAVDADQRLTTRLLAARVLGVKLRQTVYLPTLRGTPRRETFVVIAYTARNLWNQPLHDLTPALRLGGRTIKADVFATSQLPTSRYPPLGPGQTIDTGVAFKVPRGDLARVIPDGSLVFPADVDSLKEPSATVAQGWIHLDGAPEHLPAPPHPPGTPAPKQPGTAQATSRSF